MTTLLIRGARLAADPGATTSVLVRDGKIAAVGDDTRGAGAVRDPRAVLDAGDLIVAAGYVDLQCNGAHGIDLASEPERIWELAEILPAYGVTSFCPTIISSPASTVERGAREVRRRPPDFEGAEPLGLHLEGPMLNPVRRGAHQEEWICLPEGCPVQSWRPEAGVAMVTLAPELPGAIDAIRALVASGVVVSAGHTDASAEEATAAADAGVTSVTHLFNAMRPLDHREPGIVAVALADRRLTSDVILDGVHLHPSTVAAAWAALGPDRLAIVTDSSPALGSATSRGRLGGVDQDVHPDRVLTPEGRLSGSLVPMDQAVRNLVGFTGCAAERALACASAVPAGLLRRTGKGRVAVGADADLILVTEDLHVVAVMVGGRVVRAGGPWA